MEPLLERRRVHVIEQPHILDRDHRLVSISSICAWP
jgi:hypothetical protein